jgi:hypothetical protein
MYRLIYLTPDNNYHIFDSADNTEIDTKEEILNKQEFDVLCRVDYKRQLIFKKSLSYHEHRDLIDDLIFDPKYVTNY